MKLTAKDREQLSELRQGWIGLTLFMVLAFTPYAVGDKAGRQWEAFAWLVALILWLVVRPWRFGLLPIHTRKAMRLQGVLVFGFFALFSFIKLMR
jgi:hypothetical protein